MMRMATAAIHLSTKRSLQGLDISVERTPNEVELARCAFFDVRNLFDDDGSVKQLKDIDPDTRAAIAGLEIVEFFWCAGEQKHAYGHLKKIKFVDWLPALGRLMRERLRHRDPNAIIGQLLRSSWHFDPITGARGARNAVLRYRSEQRKLSSN